MNDASNPAFPVPFSHDDPRQKIIDAAPVLLSYIDTELRYRFVNMGYADWFGLPISQIIDRPVVEVIGDEAFGVIKGRLEEVLATRQAIQYETLMPYARGGKRLVHIHLGPDLDTQGIARGLVGVVTDITGQRRAEEALARREREFAALIESSPDIISRYDRSLRCVYISPAVTPLSGMPPEFYLGKTHGEMGLPTEMSAMIEDSLRRIFATGQTESVSFTVPSHEGKTVYFEANNVPLRHPDGNIESVMMVSRDVTARHQAEAEAAIRQTERIEASLRQRAFLREVLYSVSEGRFFLCSTPEDLPVAFPHLGGEPVLLVSETLCIVRHQAADAACAAGFSDERVHDLLTATGETAMNAVTHAGGGVGSVRVANDGSAIQVWIVDEGSGIAVDDLHKTFRRGYTTAGTFGHGFYLTLRTADRVYLLTGENGTTVVIENERTLPEPLWLRERKVGENG